MSRIVVNAQLGVPIDRAYAFLIDLRNDPLWWRGVRDVRVVATSDAERVYDQDVALLGRRFTTRVHVRTIEPPTRAELTSADAFASWTAIYKFAVLGPHRTSFEMDAEVALGGAYRLLEPIVIRVLQRVTRAQFRQLEQVVR